MRYTTIALALALVPVWVHGQSATPTATHSTTPHEHAAHHGAAGEMKTPCPLHLETPALTPVQDSALAAIRTAHMAEIKAVRERLGLPPMTHGDSAANAKHHPVQHAATPETTAALKEAMRASMERSLDALRATLAPAQRAKLETAVTAHATEKDALRKAGTPHRCECCD